MSISKHIDILQVGAHIGNTENDPIFKKDLTDKSLILIEPVPYLFNGLVHNYKAKQVKADIELLNIAVSDKEGTLELYVPSPTCDFTKLPWWMSQLASTTDEHFKNHNLLERFPELKLDKISVPCKTLNSIIKERNITSIDTLITDTEGHDYAILRALDLSLVKPKNIIFEHKYMDGTYKRGENFVDLTQHFYRNGYEFVKDDDEDIYLRLK